jgi:hypothetical protein
MGLGGLEAFLATGGSACSAGHTRAGGASRPTGQGQQRTPLATSALADAAQTSATRPTAGPVLAQPTCSSLKEPHSCSGSTPQLKVAKVEQLGLSHTFHHLMRGSLDRLPARLLDGQQPLHRLAHMAAEVAVTAVHADPSSHECLAGLGLSGAESALTTVE